MNKLTALITLALAFAFTTHAAAQQTVAGQWYVQKVGNTETPDTATLTLSFGDNDTATLTYTLQGETAQSWSYAYTIDGPTLILKPTTAPGTPNETEYETRFEADKLMLLPPKPEDDGDPQTPEPPDNREPIWVLSRTAPDSA